MAYSSLVGADTAPAQPSGRGSDLLGPSDNSDSGSDALGTHEAHADSDAVGTGERGTVDGVDAVAGADISPDRIVRLSADGEFDDTGEALPDDLGIDADGDGGE